MSYDTKIKQTLQRNPNAFSLVGVHQQDTTISTATVLTLPSGANGLLMQATGQNIRYTLDGSTPTASKGFVLVSNAAPVLVTFPTDDTVVTVIEATASAAVEFQFVRLYNS
jgi:hypothetical protein